MERVGPGEAWRAAFGGGGSVQRLQRIEAQREGLAPVFLPLIYLLSDPGLMEGECGGRAAGPCGLGLEPDEVLHFCCCSGTNLCTAARMILVTNVDPVSAQSEGGSKIPGEEPQDRKAEVPEN